MTARAMRHIRLAGLIATLVSCAEPVAIVRGRETRPTLVDETRVYTQVSAGFVHTCGLAQGVAWCWGGNEYDQLGAPTTTSCDGRPCSREPVMVTGGLRFASLAAGWVQNCGITTDGAVWCWGGGAIDGRGYLGDGELRRTTSPVRVATDSALTTVTIGDGHACGLTTSGVALCWGENAFGQLGDGTDVDRPTPVSVETGLRFRSLSAGAHHTCGITTDDIAFCWGDDRWGQLGIGAEHGESQLLPVEVSSGLSLVAIAAGWEHTCALAADGHAFCWGRNDNASQLGDDSGVPGRGTPGLVSGGYMYVALYAGALTTCGRTQGDALLCWGGNYHGTLGNGASDAHGVSHPVHTDGGPFRAASIGQSHTCALATDRHLWCWGDHTLGQY